MTKLNKKNWNKILKLVEENPNLQRACKKAGIARSTLYRWMDENNDFRDQVRNAQEIGQDSMNDYVEAKMMENIQNNNQRSIEFYLRHNNPRYAVNRVESEYFDKRGPGRLEIMPSGIDQVYYNTEIDALDAIKERMEVRRELTEVKQEVMYDPREPRKPETFGTIFAEEFYRAFPDAKDKIKEQMHDYHKMLIKEYEEEYGKLDL